MYDVCVVGGGAAGMSAAITAAESGKKVIIIDKNEKLGKKLYATGNGKCNITNRYIDYEKCFHSLYEDYAGFIQNSIGEAADIQVENFLEHLGILTYTNSQGYVYPASEQASALVWALIDRLKLLGVEIKSKTEVTSIIPEKNHFMVETSKTNISAAKVILCCGGRSYVKLGGTDAGYRLAEELGHDMCRVRPALCGLEVYDMPKLLSGVRIKAGATLLNQNGTTIQEEKGEVQFTDYGLSGIVIFNLSSKAGKLLCKGEKISVRLSFFDGDKRTHMENMYGNMKHRTVIGFLNGVLNDKLAGYITDICGVDGKTRLEDLDRDKFNSMLDYVFNMEFQVKSLRDFENSQVQAGGVSLADISASTFMSRKIPGLYMAGEMLDIDGSCGGYNLTFAILSGIKAGQSTND